MMENITTNENTSNNNAIAPPCDKPIIVVDHHHQQHRKKVDNYDCSNSDIPLRIVQPVLVGYRSVGIGLFGAGMRFIGMPLEKIALYMNSSQVSGTNQFQQAVKLTFQDGVLAPYKVVGVASMTAWFMQYSIMGVAFQFFDQTLSQIMNVKPMYYGVELMEPPDNNNGQPESAMYQTKYAMKTVLSPVLAACLESCVSNRAEVQRFYGPKQFTMLEQQLAASLSSSTSPLYTKANVLVTKTVGPAFLSNTMRNIIMCQTSFLLTPLTYKLYFPQEHKHKTSLFWYGLGLNVFIGNVVAITQQSLWGRTLDHLRIQQNYNISKIQYKNVIHQSIAKDGYSAFFTIPKWSSRVLMNAPAQGTLPWFYNEILPLGENTFMNAFEQYIYNPFLRSEDTLTSDVPINALLSRRTYTSTTTTTAHAAAATKTAVAALEGVESTVSVQVPQIQANSPKK